MQTKSIINSKTTVKFLVYTALSLVMFSGEFAWGEPSADTENETCNITNTNVSKTASANFCKNYTTAATNFKKCIAVSADGSSNKSGGCDGMSSIIQKYNEQLLLLNECESESECKRILSPTSKDVCEEYRTLQRDLSKACGDAGLDTKECTRSAQSCGAAFGEADTEFQVSRILGELAQTDITSSGCPQYSGQSYASKKEKFESKLEDYDEKIQKVNDRVTKSKKDNDAKIAEFNKDIAKAKKDFEQTKSKMAADEREQIQKLFEVSQSRMRQFEDLNKKVLEQNQKITVLFQQKNSTIINAAEDKIKIVCDLELAKAKKEYDATLKTNGNIFANQKQKKAFLLSKWNSCKEQVSIGVQANLEKIQQEVDMVTTQISNLESEKERMNDQIAFEKQQQDEKKASDASFISSEAARVEKEVIDINDQISKAQQHLVDEAKAAYQEIVNLENLKKQTQLKITQLGPVPPGGDTNKSVKSASNEIDRVVTSMEDSRYKTCKPSVKAEGTAPSGRPIK